jgi:hypothetical protein
MAKYTVLSCFKIEGNEQWLAVAHLRLRKDADRIRARERTFGRECHILTRDGDDPDGVALA